MEDRIILAFALIGGMLAIAGWLIISRISAKKAFEHRQSGRGKNSDS